MSLILGIILQWYNLSVTKIIAKRSIFEKKLLTGISMTSNNLHSIHNVLMRGMAAGLLKFIIYFHRRRPLTRPSSSKTQLMCPVAAVRMRPALFKITQAWTVVNSVRYHTIVKFSVILPVCAAMHIGQYVRECRNHGQRQCVYGCRNNVVSIYL